MLTTLAGGNRIPQARARRVNRRLVCRLLCVMLSKGVTDVISNADYNKRSS